jgi:exosortase E/protease (VPEID-CTERM system)
LKTDCERINLPARFGLLVALLFAEKVSLEALVDAQRAQNAAGLAAWVRLAQHWGFRYLATFLAAASIFAIVNHHRQATPRSMIGSRPAERMRWLLAHGLLVASLAPISYFLYRAGFTPGGFALAVGLWMLMCVGAVVAAGLGIVPRSTWRESLGGLGAGWIYAAAISLVGTSAWLESEKFWQLTTAVTFRWVTWILAPVVPLLSADPSTRIIATAHFAVEITEACSGLEGLGLMLAFSVIWLIYFRREYIFPQALLLIPLSMLAIFGLNALRIAALLLIGDAGYSDVALYGFHSQAGWLAFNAVACALVFFSRRSSWFYRTVPDAEAVALDNPAATYLLTLLAILAAGSVSHALSGRFETWYSLRAVAALAVLIALRRSLFKLTWSFSWRGPLLGVSVFVAWVGAVHWLLPPLSMPQPLIDLLPLERLLWMAGHCLSSIALVPIAEELAYRGYLMRRLMNADFESVPYRTVRWPALSVSAIAFGAAHGTLWLPGIAAGLAYGWIVVRRDSLGEAVAAHATTNALLAATVLAGDQWQFW